MRTMVRAIGLQDWRETIDRFHVMEKLALFLSLAFPDDDRQRAKILRRWNRSLDRSDRAIYRIRRWLYKVELTLTGRRREEFMKHLGCYFVDTTTFRYASLAALGLQQGSGVTEGACKSLVTMRAKRSGQRWREEGIRAVLALRSLLSSERLESFWSRFVRRFHFDCVAA
jgi:hypothetical protein